MLSAELLCFDSCIKGMTPQRSSSIVEAADGMTASDKVTATTNATTEVTKTGAPTMPIFDCKMAAHVRLRTIQARDHHTPSQLREVFAVPEECVRCVKLSVFQHVFHLGRRPRESSRSYSYLARAWICTSMPMPHGSVFVVVGNFAMIASNLGFSIEDKDRRTEKTNRAHNAKHDKKKGVCCLKERQLTGSRVQPKNEAPSALCPEITALK